MVPLTKLAQIYRQETGIIPSAVIRPMPTARFQVKKIFDHIYFDKYNIQYSTINQPKKNLKCEKYLLMKVPFQKVLSRSAIYSQLFQHISIYVKIF